MSEEKKTSMTKVDFDKLKTLSSIIDGPEFAGTIPLDIDQLCKVADKQRVAVLFVKSAEFAEKKKGKKGKDGKGKATGKKVPAVRFVCQVEGMDGKFSIFTARVGFVETLIQHEKDVPFTFTVRKAGSGSRTYFRPV